jgi:heme/copper-type cytochrome/quinol oxidase subunit 1
MTYECTDNGSSTICISEASTSPMYYNGFSYDGIMQIFFLLLIFIITFLNFTTNTLVGVKNRKKIYD